MSAIRKTIEEATTPTDTEGQTLERLAALTIIEYDRVRKAEAKRLGIRTVALDKSVEKQRRDNLDESTGDELEDGVEPWPDPVNGQALFHELISNINKYCALPAGADIALALFSMGSYDIDLFRIFPKICLSSPEKRCGKTTTLETISAIVNRPLLASNITAPVLFRAIEAWRPTLLIDEADTFINANDELRGVINSGHTRSSAYVLRVEGDGNDRQPVKFSTWAPMVIAMIKTPPSTIQDRSIMIMLRRKLPGESVEKLPFDLPDACVDIRRKCKRWVADNAHNIRATNSSVPKLQSDRAMDNWLPLLKIADILGGGIPSKARDAMRGLETQYDDDESVGPMLLNDLREVFEKGNFTKIFSDKLVEKLIDMEERPWCEWRHGKPLTKNSLAKLLKAYSIKSRNIRSGALVKRGYLFKDFQDSFSRYLAAPTTQSTTTLHSSGDAVSSEFQNATRQTDVALQNVNKPNCNAGCSIVALQNQLDGSEKCVVDTDAELI